MVQILLSFLALLAMCSADTCINLNCTATTISYPNFKSNATYTYRIGFLRTVSSDPTTMSLVRWAVNFINNQTDILPNVTLQLYDLEGSQTLQMVTGTLELVQNKVVNAMIMELEDSDTAQSSSTASAFQVPQISVNSITQVFSNKTFDRPYLVRLPSPYYYQCAALIAVLKKLNATSFVYVYTSDVYGLSGFSLTSSLASRSNISIISVPVDPGAINANIAVSDSVEKIVKIVALDQSRIFFIATSTTEGIPFIKLIREKKLFGPALLYLYAYSMYSKMDQVYASVNATDVFDGALALLPRPFVPSVVYDTISTAWQSSDQTMFPGMRPDPASGYMHTDAVYYLAASLDSLLKQGVAFSAVTGPRMLSAMKTASLLGVTGTIKLDFRQDRASGDYLVYNLAGGALRSLGSFSSVYLNFSQTSSFVFYNGSTANPLNVTRVLACGVYVPCKYGTCGANGVCTCMENYYGLLCDELIVNNSAQFSDNLPWLIPVLVVVVALLIGGITYIKRKRAQLVRDVTGKQRSEIDRKDIKLSDRIGRGAAGEVYKAQFRGTDVAVKRLITTNTSKSAIEEFQFETAIMCGLRHPNIILFMGSSFDPVEKEMLLVMELMLKGSLHDVLLNPKISLPYELQLHIACQSAQGMNFLHESNPPIIHRDLKSHNILLDDKWNARISDFGITKFKEVSAKKSDKQTGSLGTILWTAPEVLDEKAHSEKSDCYAFGIVLWEIFHRQEPYAGKEAIAIALAVLNKGIRPEIDSNCPQEIKELIKECWDQNPELRPSFRDITSRLRNMVMHRPVPNFGTQHDTRVQPPSGQVFIVHTEVNALTALWSSAPRATETALFIHNNMLRANMESYGGYEVSIQGTSSFMVVFASLEIAFNWCIASQISLLQADWPQALLEVQQGSMVTGPNKEVLYRGLRVRMSIHMGTPNCDINLSNGKMNYTGPVVDKAKQLLRATKGWIIASSVVAEELAKHTRTFIEDIIVEKDELGGEHTASHILPKSLARRAPKDIAELNNVSSFSEYTETAELDEMDGADEETKWLIPNNALAMKGYIGKGAVGDFSKAYWDGKEVAVKLLVNQKLREVDLIRFTADAAILNQLHHPNLLPFYGICLDPTHISIISQYMPPANLRVLLSNDMVQIPFPKRVKVARDIATGMSYLSSVPDPNVCIHDNLRSHNVLVSNEWDVRITDFGQGNVKDLARTMTAITNVAWTAPEILSGDGIGIKSAIYSFGIIMWELYTRRTPHENEHPIKVVTKIQAGFRPPVPDDCPTGYRQIMTQCWETDPEQRPSWVVIMAELEQLM